MKGAPRLSRSLETVLDELRELVEAEMRRLLFVGHDHVPTSLREAMEYACFPGGKRLRPVLAVMSCRAHGGEDQAVLPAAVALELIHCYSLVHDDLPAMDDDDLRRGRPTCHKVYGEALAILAGDALLTRALELVARHSPATFAAPLTAEIAMAAGMAGMVGGQVADLQGENSGGGETEVRWIHEHKTAELIRVSVRAGAVAAGVVGAPLGAADRFGSDLGMAFQIVDDLLGRSGSPEVTGKPVGKDDARCKLTYPAVVGEEAARERVSELTRSAQDSAASFPEPTDLQRFAQKLKERVA